MKQIKIEKDEIEIKINNITKSDIDFIVNKIYDTFDYKRCISDEHRQKLSDAGRNKTLTTTHKIKISAAMTKRWAERKAKASSSETK